MGKAYDIVAEAATAEAEELLPLIPHAGGLRRRHSGRFVLVQGPCGQKHIMDLDAGRALAIWLNQHCQPIREADFITIYGEDHPEC